MQNIFSIILFLISSVSYAQIYHGFVKDRQNGETLPGATIQILDTDQITQSNSYGYFVFNASIEKPEIRVSYVGYQTLDTIIHYRGDSLLTFYLIESSEELEELAVTAESKNFKPIGLTSIPVSRLTKIPVLFGEADIIKALMQTPGATAGNEGTSGMLVRGGTPDQNLVLLDGANVYNSAHLFGLVSVINPDAISKVDLYKGSFPARYGGRLSSVLDMQMKEGNVNEPESEFTLGILSSKYYRQGPLLKNDKHPNSYLFSARSAYLTPFFLPGILALRAGIKDQAYNYMLYDFNLKANYQWSRKVRFYGSAYRGRDTWSAWSTAGNEKSKFQMKWGNMVLSGRMSFLIQPKIFFNAHLSYSAYQYRIQSKVFGRDSELWQNVSKVQDLSFKTYFEWYPANFTSFRFGADLLKQRFNPAKIKTTFESNSFDNGQNGFEVAMFAENELKFFNRFSVNSGYRLVRYQVSDKTWLKNEPRVSANLKIFKNLELKAGYSQMNQFMHLLNSSSAGLPNDIWVPVTNKISPGSSIQKSLGISQSIGDWEISFERYQKNLSNLVDYSNGKSFLTNFNENWESLVITSGLGRIKGYEFFVNKKSGLMSGWLGYTWSKSEIQFAELNDAKWFAGNFDRRHIINTVLNFTPEGGNKSFNFSWIYQSGRPFTLPVAVYETIFENQENQYGSLTRIYGDRNNVRMPDYHRLDLSVTFNSLSQKRKRAVQFILGVYNAYNRQNPYYLQLKSEVNDDRNSINNQLFSVGVVPILPYFSYNLKLK